jgi:hypothetical protein
MHIFILCSLLLTTLVQNHNPYLPLLNNEPVWLSAGGLAALFILLGWLKKLPATIWQDGFACSGLLAWYAYWKPLFSPDSPLFYAFPIYFSLLGIWMLTAFINKGSRFDDESRALMRILEKHLAGFDSCLMAAIALICIALPEHYLSYPLAMTFFILRATFQRCIENIGDLDSSVGNK